MKLWWVGFQVSQSLAGFPVPVHLEAETQTGTSYRCRGGPRRNETDALFVITLSGEGEFRYENHPSRLPPGTCFLARPVDPEVMWLYPEDATAPWTFMWLRFQGEESARMVDGLNRRHGHVHDVGLENGLVRRLLAFQAASGSVRMLPPNAGARLVFEILTTVAAVRETGHLDDPRNLLIRRARQIVLEEIENNVSVSVSAVARRLSLSREHLSRVFKAGTGASLENFIVRGKMTRGCELLKDTPLSCKEIAAKLGYDNPTNFSRAFKRTLGMTPKEFRKGGAIPMV